MNWTERMTLPFAYDDDGRVVSLGEALFAPPAKAAKWMAEFKKQAATSGAVKRTAVKENQIQEVDEDEIDIELDSPNKFFGSHINLIPLQSAVAGPRLFYGARFMNQALPVTSSEEPLVQALVDGDPEGRSFDDITGNAAGAVRSKSAGVVKAIDNDGIDFVGDDGVETRHGLYNNFEFNRKTSIHNTPVVAAGEKVAAGGMLAKSNYTDSKGTLALGLNARIGLVPYLGKSMDDAIVISEAFAKRLTSGHLYGHDLDYKRGVTGGKAHFTGLFPHKYNNTQLDMLDDDGVAKVGQIVNRGDPIILASRPRVVSSSNSQLGLLSKHMKNARSAAEVLWHHDTPGVILDVHKLRSSVKVNVSADVPTSVGDKIVMRSGQKNTISEVLPDDKMPRTADGKPLEVLFNPLGLPSRVNNSLVYEMLLGKVAQKKGKPFRLATFNRPEEKWYDFVKQQLDENGLSDTENVFDPVLNKELENPITVGPAYILRLHHTAESKVSSRGQGSYDNNEQPSRGGGEHAQAKRLSGLEASALLSAGAYNILRESSTLHGQKNDQYWRDLRAGHEPKEPGEPFVFGKFRAMLNGAGYMSKKLPGGKERLTFWSDKDLDKHRTIEVKSGDMVDLGTLEPTPGGLFDSAITGSNSWGHIPLDFPVVNPAAEDVIRNLLGLTKQQFRKVMAGDMHLPPHLLVAKNDKH